MRRKIPPAGGVLTDDERNAIVLAPGPIVAQLIDQELTLWTNGEEFEVENASDELMVGVTWVSEALVVLAMYLERDRTWLALCPHCDEVWIGMGGSAKCYICQTKVQRGVDQDCPMCGAEGGTPCRTKNNTAAVNPHAKRAALHPRPLEYDPDW